MRRAAMLALVLAAAACATPPPASPDADEAMRKGRYARALALYEADLARRPGDDLLREKVASARSRVVSEHLEAAHERIREGRLEAAEKHLDTAAAVDPQSGAVLEARADLASRRARLEERIAEARRLIDAGKATEASVILLEVSASWRDHPALPGLATRAMSDAMKRAVEEARAAEAAGEPGRALRVLDVRLAPYRTPWPPAVTAAYKDLRARIASRLMVSVGKHVAAGRAGSALLLARAAAELDSASPEVAGVLEGAKSLFLRQHAGEIAVGPFEDRTGGLGDTEALAAAVRAKLESAPPAEFLPPLAVTGSLDRIAVTEGEPVTRNAVFTPVLRVDRTPNPSHREGERAIANLEIRLRDAERVLGDRKEELDELERLGGSAYVRSGARYYGPYAEARYFRILGDARQNEAAARETRDRISDSLDRAKERLAATPPYLEKEVRGRVTVKKTVRTKSAVAAATVVLGDRPPVHVEATRTVKDASHGGDAATGLAPDPDELPSGADLAAATMTDLAAKIAAEIGSAVPALREDLFARAREAEAAGDAATALDLYAAYALTVRDGLARATAVRKVRGKWGIDLSGPEMDLSDLRYE